ncbi:MAG TPA: DUF2510 domain-containing protein [Acidimicrobiales bacterium]|nr:DUF2510 domain-containing protein [Acidimicrobiales bacterium]
MFDSVVAVASHAPMHVRLSPTGHFLGTLPSGLLATTKPTLPKVSTARAVFIYSVLAVDFALGAGIAYYRRKRKGIYPWRLHPVIWGMIFVLLSPVTYISVVGLILIGLAWRFTPETDDPTANPGRRRVVMPAGSWQHDPGRTGADGEGEDGNGKRFAPGTYGTSLPPHEMSDDEAERDAGTNEEPAGWLTDPSGRHEYRYWNGTGWTKHVSDKGKRATDSL